MQLPKEYSLQEDADISIQDNGEPLVDILTYCPNVKIDLDKRRMEREKTAYLRETVAEMLRKAYNLLPEGMTFVIRDAWRPAYVQCYTYFWFIRMFQNKHPEWNMKRVITEVEQYVAPWKGDYASGHMTGGAVDLRILTKNGRLLPMRSRYLTYQENALSDQPKLSKALQKNRTFFVDIMTASGLSNYLLEFWHWTYGDFYWAKRTGAKKTLYAPIADCNDLYVHLPCPCGGGKIFEECHGK